MDKLILSIKKWSGKAVKLHHTKLDRIRAHIPIKFSNVRFEKRKFLQQKKFTGYKALGIELDLYMGIQFQNVIT